ncbi:hypothetical protein GF406_25790 [candidate division KSB1 bacterium]|nr:hypothetical protein [candidate division KSB1 bacterium]
MKKYPFILVGIQFLAFVFMDLVSAQSGQALFDQDQLQPKVREIFRINCALVGCHTGSDPQQNMSLDPQDFVANTVQQSSQERPQYLRIAPGKPDSSYLVMKIRGSEAIQGEQMPLGEQTLSQQEITTIIAWIQSLGEIEPKSKPRYSGPILPFASWSVINIPTSRTLESGIWLFYIGHRFLPKIDTGYETFYGLDGSAAILLRMGYAINNDFLLQLGRSNIGDLIEVDTKYRILKQNNMEISSFAAAGRVVLNWITQKEVEEDFERLQVSGQIVFSKQIHERLALNLVPGILYNPDGSVSDESPLTTLGLGVQIGFWDNISFTGEWVPILGGYSTGTPLTMLDDFDSWSAGVQAVVGGHVFHVFVTNTFGLATSQQLQGGDWDLFEGDFRLGFNIYRLLDF